MTDTKDANAPTPVLLIGEARAAQTLFQTIAAMLEGASDVTVRTAPAETASDRASLAGWAAKSGNSGHAIIIAHGMAADALVAALGSSIPVGPLALLHPMAPPAEVPKVTQGRDVLITAGAADPETPAATIGALADALDEAGAKTDVFWNRGGAEITEAEIERIIAWLNAARGASVDPRTLPVAMETEGPKGRYFIEAPGGITAEMTFSRASETLIIIDHTEVPDIFRGTGTGLRLVETLIADARTSGTKIIPLCPFAAAQFKRHPEWGDVLETKVRMKPKAGPRTP
jgi:predicted GNAT family acetyltransferase